MIQRPSPPYSDAQAAHFLGSVLGMIFLLGMISSTLGFGTMVIMAAIADAMITRLQQHRRQQGAAKLRAAIQAAQSHQPQNRRAQR